MLKLHNQWYYYVSSQHYNNNTWGQVLSSSAIWSPWGWGVGHEIFSDTTGPSLKNGGPKKITRYSGKMRSCCSLLFPHFTWLSLVSVGWIQFCCQKCKIALMYKKIGNFYCSLMAFRPNVKNFAVLHQSQRFHWNPTR